jgi:hypothetical protein
VPYKNKADRKKNSEKINAQRSANRAANREKINAASREYRAANRERLNALSRERRAADRDKYNAADRERNTRPDVKQKRHDYYLANKKRLRANGSAWRKANIEKHRAYEARLQREKRARDPKGYAAHMRAYRAAHIEYFRKMEAERSSKRRESGEKKRYYDEVSSKDPIWKLAMALRNRLRAALNRESKRGSAVKLLGCSIAEFKVYLENLFLPGMRWENWGLKGWHIDHIRALSLFDLTDPVQLAEACHHTNLQPLWASENISKGGKNRVAK